MRLWQAPGAPPPVEVRGCRVAAASPDARSTMDARPPACGGRPILTGRVVLVLLIAIAAPAAAQAQGRRQQRPVDADRIPVSVERIQEQLQHEPAIDLELLKPVFRVEIVEKRPEWFAEIDWLDRESGSIPAGSSWHDQFLGMVTPEMARSYGAFTNSELLQVTATSIAQALASKVIIGRAREAIRRRREEAARREVDEAIARWKREREAQQRERQVAQ